MSFYGKVYNYITSAVSKFIFQNGTEEGQIVNPNPEDSSLTLQADNTWIQFETNNNNGVIKIQHKELNTPLIENQPFQLAFKKNDEWVAYEATIDSAGHLIFNPGVEITPQPVLVTYTDHQDGRIELGKSTRQIPEVIDEGIME